MAIRASSSKQIDELIADLGAAGAVTRETAVARLTLLGARAVERLIAIAAGGDNPEARIAAWRALEAIGDPRALPPALAALAAPDLEPGSLRRLPRVARLHVRGAHGAAVVDRLAEVLLDRTRDETRSARRAACVCATWAIDDRADSLVARRRSERGDSPRGGRRPRGTPHSDDSPAAVILQAAAGVFPDDPTTLRDALKASEQSVPTEVLHKVIDRRARARRRRSAATRANDGV